MTYRLPERLPIGNRGNRKKPTKNYKSLNSNSL